jgi:glycosyltransferase 2 family protein
VSPSDAGQRSVARRRVREVVRLALVVLAFGLGAAAIGRDLEGFVGAIRDIGAARAGAALVAVLAGLLITSEVWRTTVAATAGPLAGGAARRLFFVTQLGKYLPGAVWPVLAQAEAAQRHGLAASRMALGSLLFVAVHLLTGLVLALTLIPWSAPGVLTTYPWVLAAIPLLAIGLLPPVLGRAMDLGLWLLRREPLAARPSGRAVATASSLLLGTWAAYGLAAYLVTAPLQTTGGRAELAALATGAFALAWAVGVLVLPAPAGVGPRELVLVLAWSPLLGLTGATSAAIVLRVIHTVGDLALAVLARLDGRHRVLDDGRDVP